MAFVVIYDACVLYPASVRDVLVRLAQTRLFRAHWTTEIEEEVLRNLAGSDARRDAAWQTRLRDQMRAAVPDCLVTGHGQLIPAMDLPDPDDRHVLAAAIRAGAQVIATYNTRDFPAAALAPYGIDALHPDEFLANQLDLNEPLFLSVIKAQREGLSKPALTADELLERFERNQLTTTAARLRKSIELL